MHNRGDMYGKLDALFEKRSADGLIDRALDRDDFPELTDVIGANQPAKTDGVDLRENRGGVDRQQSLDVRHDALLDLRLEQIRPRRDRG